MTVMRTYKFKFYQNKKNKNLSEAIDIASEVWNYSIAMYRGYYKLFGKTLSKYTLQKHITKIKKRPEYAHWSNLGSQAIQDVVDRVDKSYKAFFDHLKNKRKGRKSPPHFCKRSKYKSFTLKQTGYQFQCESNKVVIMGRSYKLAGLRPMNGAIKTVTVKRTALGEFFLTVVCQEEVNQVIPRTGNAVGYDFGLKQFLTADDGSAIKSPLWYSKSVKELRAAHRAVSMCVKGSNNRKRAIANLNRCYERVSNQRRDWFFKVSNEITQQYADIFIEDLNIDGMKRVWGRKVSDMAFSEFVGILEWVAYKNGSTVTKIGRWMPSSKVCHVCGTLNTELSLEQREWTCSCCNTHHARDVNAAINIKNMGLAMRSA